MKGQRRENSVLFSLSHLQELAHPVDEPVEKTGSSGNTGLLQIKAMSGPSAALLLPQDPAEGKQRGLGTVLAVAFLGVILGAGVLVGILYLIQPNLVKALLSGQEIAIADDSQEQAPPLAAKTAPDANKPVLLASAASLPDASSAPSVASNADAGIGARDAAVADEAVPGSQPPGVGEADRVAPAPRKRSRRKIRRRRRSRGGGITVEDPGPEDELDVAVRGDGAKKDDPAPETPAPTEPVKPPEPEKKDSKGPKDLDDLLDEATKGKLPAERGKKGDVPKDTPAPGATALPKSLSRAQVSAGMKRANPGVKMCYKQFKELGLVTIQATIDGGTGKITSARVVGGFANTPVGGCVLSAVKSRTYFPRFTGPPLTLKYPYMLR